MASLLAVATASLIIPATLYAVIADEDNQVGKHPAPNDPTILLVSRGTAIILLLLYILYLFFQLKTHASLFDEESGKDDPSAQGNDPNALASANGTGPDSNAPHDSSAADDGEKKEGDTLSPIAAGIALVIITVLVAICAEYLVDSIDAIVQRAHISKTFIGLILLPIVGNAAEHVTAVVVSWKDKMNLALGVAIGSSLQIALFVTPALVIVGWAIGSDMTLHFQMFETVVFFISVLIVNYLIGDGKRYVDLTPSSSLSHKDAANILSYCSNYLEGAMLIGVYAIIALAFYVYPDEAGQAGGMVMQLFGRGGQ